MIAMTAKPTYEELERRVAELEGRSRRLAELHGRLKRSLNFTESLLASIPTPVFWKDADGRYQGCNAAFTEIMGVTSERIRGKTVQDLWPGEQAGVYRRKDLELLENPRHQVYEFEVKDKRGRVRPVVYYKNVFLDENGTVAGLVGGFVDIGDIRKARLEHRTLFSMSLDMICVADINTATFLKVNPAFTATLGYGESELLSAPFTDFIHPEDIGPTREVVEKCLRKGEKVINFKNRYRCRNGEYRYLNWVSHPVPEEGVTYAVAHDVTEEIRAYEALRDQRNLLNSLFDNLPVGISVWDAEGRPLMINKGFTEITGYAMEDVGGLDDWLSKACPGPDYPRTMIEGWRTTKESAAVRELKVTCRDGGVKDVEFRGIFLKDGRFLATLSDVTDRVRGEEALRTSHKRFFKVLNSIDATIYVADMKTYEILFMNRRMIEDFGGDLTGEICHEVFRKQPAPCPHCTNDRLIDQNGRSAGVVVWQGQNPVSGKWYINYDRAIEWIDGRMVRIQIATDITDHKKMEDALRKAQRMEAVGTLASGVAHDFNNLLMGIQGRASLISVDLDPGHPHAEHARAIEEYIESAVGLTRQLLGLARGGKYEVKPVDINALLESTAAMFGRTRKQLRIRAKTAEEPLVVEADKGQIEQVLLNMYVNAWQAMPDGGDLYLEARSAVLDENASLAYRIPPGDYVKISLTDTGVGMPEEVLRKVFDPFFTTREKGRGTGLGLASAYGIVRNHGGTITVYSEVGHGSTFTIYLPRCRKSLVSEAPTKGKPVGGTEAILLIDDEAMITEVAEAMLATLGYRVIAVNDGESAVQTVKRMGDGIDLVVLDMIMPGMDGGKTFDRIREIRPSVPVILSSGYSIDGQAAEIMERGCDGFIQKPFDISELARKVREVLDRREK